MPGTALNLSTQKISTGPGHLWLNVAIPAAGARITLHTDGTPESVANPSAKNLGLTKTGNKVAIKWSKQDSEADELTSPYRTILSADDMSIQGDMLQLEDFANVLRYLTPNATYATAAGYEQMTVGGLTAIAAASKPSVALIWAQTADPTKFAVAHMYQAVNDNGLEFDITRKADASTQFNLKGQSIASRTAGDQVGNLWKQI